MMSSPREPSNQPTGAGTPTPKILKFSKKRLALAFAIAAAADYLNRNPAAAV